MRGRRKAEPQLVTDLMVRLQSYTIQGMVVCRGCRAWTSSENARTLRWSFSDGAGGVVNFYCPECLQREFGLTLHAAD